MLLGPQINYMPPKSHVIVLIISRAFSKFSQNYPSREGARAIWKTLKIQVKSILNCPRAITCLPHKGQLSRCYRRVNRPRINSFLVGKSFCFSTKRLRFVACCFSFTLTWNNRVYHIAGNVTECWLAETQHFFLIRPVRPLLVIKRAWIRNPDWYIVA